MSAGTYTLLDVDNNTDGPNGLPSIAGALTINGNGSTVERGMEEGIPDFRIFHVQNTGSLIVKNLTVSNGKSAEGESGGGLYNRGTLSLSDCDVAGNRAGNGGGIYNWGVVSIANCTIDNNETDTWGNGGGIYNAEGTMTIVNSTISGNSSSSGGGIYNSAPVTIESCTIAENGGGFGGGGISSPALQFLVTLEHTIVASNTAYVSPNCTRQGAVASLGYNLIGERGECGYDPDIGDIFASNPLLGPLADNGGSSLTHALLAGSPAIDAGGNSNCPETDQRGFPRPVDGDNDGEAICDIGSFEAQRCDGDFEPDGDVDGTDLCTQAQGGTMISDSDFSQHFGRNDCPIL